MNYLSRLMSILSCVLSMVVNAANIPNVINGAEKYTRDMCISNTTSDCIDSVCMNSSATDCPDKCLASARAKCQAISE